MYKVVTIVGTRPEIIRLSSILKKFDKHFKHFLIHTGQNYDYELNQIFFKDLGLKKPFKYLNVSKNSPCSAVGDVIKKTGPKNINPMQFILGDTNSYLGLYSAKIKNSNFSF